VDTSEHQDNKRIITYVRRITFHVTQFVMLTNTTRNTHTIRTSPTFLTDCGCHSLHHDHSVCAMRSLDDESRTTQLLVMYHNDRNAPTIKRISL